MNNFQKFVDKNCFNIWRYDRLYKEFIEPKFRLSIGEGWTKEQEFEELNKKLKIEHLYFKREDLNPLGSFKVRGMAYQISRAWQAKIKKFSISSTGNAALAAAYFCQRIEAPLFIFMHQRPKLKEKREKILKEIKRFGPEKIFFKEEPTKKCREFSKNKGIYNLTPSIDPFSSEGFKSIGFEIFEKIGEIDAIFSFATSGSAVIGIGESFKFLKKEKLIKKIPRIYPVAISKIKRGKEIKKLIKESKGEILMPGKETIEKAKKILLEYGILTSIEGICAFAGFLQKNKFKKVVIILSGKVW